VTKKRVHESRVRQRQADETRSRIAAGAMQLLSEKGYAGMTVPVVAKAAGVAVPTVYPVFGSKMGIVAELMDRHNRSKKTNKSGRSGEGIER